MIKAEYDHKKHGISIIMKCHCIPVIKAELLFIINACFEQEPDATLDVIKDFMNVLKENMQHDS